MYIAKTLVLGTPLNSTAPDRCGMNKPSRCGSSTIFFIKLAGFLPSGNNTGQNGAEGQQGTINVPCALVLLACCITRSMRWIGGHHQLVSFPQLQVKASTASDPRLRNLELKRGTCLL